MLGLFYLLFFFRLLRNLRKRWFDALTDNECMLKMEDALAHFAQLQWQSLWRTRPTCRKSSFKRFLIVAYPERFYLVRSMNYAQEDMDRMLLGLRLEQSKTKWRERRSFRFFPRRTSRRTPMLPHTFPGSRLSNNCSGRLIFVHLVNLSRAIRCCSCAGSRTQKEKQIGF